MKYLPLLFRNLRRQLRRTALTALAFAISTLLFTTLDAVPASLDRIEGDFNRGLRVVVNNYNGPYGLPARYCDEIRAMPHVTGCAPMNLFYMMYRSPQESIGLYAIDREFLKLAPDIKIPPAQVRQLETNRRGAIAGRNLLKKYHWKVGQEIMLQAFNYKFHMSFVLVGESTDPRLPDNFFFQRAYLLETLEGLGVKQEIRPLFLIAGVDNGGSVGQVIKEIDENFRNADTETLTETESDSIATQLSYFGNIRAIIFSLCLVVIVSVLLVAANSMAMMVRERLSDVAVMRALGFSRARVGILLLGEALSIGLIGGAIGAALALALFGNGMSLAMFTAGFGQVAVSYGVAAGSIVVALVVSTASAAIPVISAMGVSPAMAFRPIV